MTALQSSIVTVYNADYTTLRPMSWKKAVRLILKGKAVVEDIDPFTGRHLRAWPYPETIRLVKIAKVNRIKMNGDALFSKSGVLKRDKHKCCFCGRSAKTIDHVLPRSRGGANNYMNTVAACFSCNNKKDNKTPKEAGMKMLWQPYTPTKAQLMGK